MSAPSRYETSAAIAVVVPGSWRRQAAANEAADHQTIGLRAIEQALQNGRAEFDTHMADLLAYLNRRGVTPRTAVLYRGKTSTSSTFARTKVISAVPGYVVEYRGDDYERDAAIILPTGKLLNSPRRSRSENEPREYHPFVPAPASINHMFCRHTSNFCGYTFVASGQNGIPSVKTVINGMGGYSAEDREVLMEDAFAKYAQSIIDNHATSLQPE